MRNQPTAGKQIEIINDELEEGTNRSRSCSYMPLLRRTSESFNDKPAKASFTIYVYRYQNSVNQSSKPEMDF